jgi:CBS domain-containing protein
MTMQHQITALDILEHKSPRMITLPPDATLGEAVEKMIENNIGAMLISDGDDIIGIWTERDHLKNSLAPGYDLKTNRIGDFMQTRLHTASGDTSIIALQETFLGLFIRHILIAEEGKHIGLLSVGDVMRAVLLQKDREIKELHQIASWEYYENWGWHRKHHGRKRDHSDKEE